MYLHLHRITRSKWPRSPTPPETIRVAVSRPGFATRYKYNSPCQLRECTYKCADLKDGTRPAREMKVRGQMGHGVYKQPPSSDGRFYCRRPGCNSTSRFGFLGYTTLEGLHRHARKLGYHCHGLELYPPESSSKRRAADVPTERPGKKSKKTAGFKQGGSETAEVRGRWMI